MQYLPLDSPRWPIIFACVIAGETSSFLATRKRNLAVSKAVPVPNTWCGGKPLNFHVRYANKSTGSVATMSMASGQCDAISGMISL